MVGVWEQGHRKQRGGGPGNRDVGSTERGTWEQGCRKQREGGSGNTGHRKQREKGDLGTGV
jgi:hypothetical protein